MIKKIVISIGLVLISSVVAILLFEIGIRQTSYEALLSPSAVWFPRYYQKSDPELGFDLKENFSPRPAFLREERYKMMVWSNDLGCFDKPYDGKEDYVLIVGDSFTYSYSNYDFKWTTFIEKTIGKRVLKCGVGGFGTYQALLKAKKIINKIGKAPKLIILGHYVNDFYDDYMFPTGTVIEGFRASSLEELNTLTGKKYPTQRNEAIKDTYERWQRCGLSRDQFKFPANISCWLYQNTFTYRNLKNRWLVFSQRYFKQKVIFQQDLGGDNKRQAIDPSQEDQDKEPLNVELLALYPLSKRVWLKDLWENHLTVLALFKDYAKEVNSQFMVVLMPEKAQLYKDLILYRRDYYLRGGDFSLLMPNALLIPWLNWQRIDYVDLLSNFQEYVDASYKGFLNPHKRIYWLQDGHWNRRGDYLVGLILSKKILNYQNLELDKDQEYLSKSIERRLIEFKNQQLK